jgi:hypothetical protein
LSSFNALSCPHTKTWSRDKAGTEKDIIYTLISLDIVSSFPHSIETVVGATAAGNNE